MRKKLIGIGLVIAMIFTFTACNLGDDINALRAAGKAEIDTHVATLIQTDYTAGNWQDILQIAADGKAEVDVATTKSAITTVVDETKEAINKIEKEDEMDFILTILVDKTTVTHGQKITANAVLKNNSGQSQDIAFFQPVISPLYSCWTIPGWYFYEDIHVQFPEIPPSYLLVKDDSTSFSDFLWVDNEQEKGVFELQLCFNIYLNFGQPNEEIVIVKSNKVNITVQ